MKKRLVLSDAAVADVVEQADWYAKESGTRLAGRWEKAVTAAVFRVFGSPASGTRCAFRAPELAEVRRARISGFAKHLLFYKFDGEEVFILRVVHGARDLEHLLIARKGKTR